MPVERMNIVIIGAGGFGREVLEWIRDAVAAGRLDAAPRGFLDDTDPDLTTHGIDLPVLGPIDPALLRPDDACVVAVGAPAHRLRIAALLADAGVRFVSVVHPSAVVSGSARIQQGAVVCPFGFVGPGAEVGAHALVNIRASVGHDAQIGRAAVLSPHACVCGGVTVGDGVMLGAGVLIMPRCQVGEAATVAPGAVVHSSIPAHAFAFGNPAASRPKH